MMSFSRWESTSLVISKLIASPETLRLLQWVCHLILY